MGSVFDHMLALLAPDGWMVHTIDMSGGRLPEWQGFLADYFQVHGVAPAAFAIRPLDEMDSDSAPLFESLEVQYTIHGLRRDCARVGTLVLCVHRLGLVAGANAH
jgi:threonine dehydrogenase-like Zn-dependent dehydrogenase